MPPLDAPRITSSSGRVPVSERNCAQVLVEGRDTDWMVVDFGAVMVHSLTPEAFTRLDLLNAWSEVGVLVQEEDYGEYSEQL